MVNVADVINTAILGTSVSGGSLANKNGANTAAGESFATVWNDSLNASNNPGQNIAAAGEKDTTYADAGQVQAFSVPANLSVEAYRQLMPGLYHSYHTALSSGDTAAAEQAQQEQAAVVTAYYQSRGMSESEAVASAQTYSPFQYSIGGQNRTGAAIVSGTAENLRLLGAVDPGSIRAVEDEDYFVGSIKFNDSMKPEQLQTYGWNFAELAKEAEGTLQDARLVSRLQQLAAMQAAGSNTSELQYCYDTLSRYYSVGNLNQGRSGNFWANMGAATLSVSDIFLNANAVVHLSGVAADVLAAAEELVEQ